MCSAASAVLLSESVNLHFTGPSRSGHVKVGRDTWARANVWRKRNDEYVDCCSFANLTNYLCFDLPGRDARLETGIWNEEVVDDHPIFLAIVRSDRVY